MDEEQERLRLLAEVRQRQARARAGMATPTGSDLGSRVGALLTPEGQAARRPEPAAPGPIETIGNSVANGAALGWGDNVAALIGAAAGRTTGPGGERQFFDYSGDFGARYDERLGAVRERLDAGRAEHPILTTLGEVAGGAGTAVASLPATVGRGALRTAGRMVGTGAAEGAVVGAGMADGEDVAGNALRGGLVGGALGVAVPGVVAGVRAVADPVVGAVQAMRSQPYLSRAGRHMATVLQRAGRTPEEIEAALTQAAIEGQDVFTTADALGPAGQRALAGVARQPGEGAAEVAEHLRARQQGQGDRVAGFVTEALGLSDNTAAAVRREQAARRSAMATPNYEMAREGAGPVDVRAAVDVIDQRLGPMRNSGGIRGDSLDARLSSYRSRLASAPGDQPAMELSDFSRVLGVKQDLQDDIGAAVRAGRNNEARQLTLIARALDGALEEASPAYRRANDTFAAQSTAIDAIDVGRAAAGRMRTDDALGSYNALRAGAFVAPRVGPAREAALALPEPGAPARSSTGEPVPGTDQREAFRVGYGDRMIERVENIRPNQNALLEFITPKNQEMMAAMARDPDLWARRLAREETMVGTADRALGGSRTADNLADQDDVNNIGLLANIVAGRWGAAAGDLTRRTLSAGTGMNEQTRTLVAQALLSREPQRELRSLIEAGRIHGEQMRAAEALVRHMSYAGAMQGGTAPSAASTP